MLGNHLLPSSLAASCRKPFSRQAGNSGEAAETPLVQKGGQTLTSCTALRKPFPLSGPNFLIYTMQVSRIGPSLGKQIPSTHEFCTRRFNQPQTKRHAVAALYFVGRPLMVISSLDMHRCTSVLLSSRRYSLITFT